MTVGARPDQTLQLTITGRITDLTEAVAAVKANPDVGRIVIKLDSRGGDHGAASALFNALLEHRAHCTIIVGEFCQSAALMILMAGHRRICHPSSCFMVHSPTHALYQTAERYTAAELRRLADEVDSVADEILETLSCIKPEHRPFIEQALTSFEGEVFGVEKAQELGLIHATTEEEAKRIVERRIEGLRRQSPIKIEATAYSKGPVSITTDPITVTWANCNRLTEPVNAPVSFWDATDQEPEAGQTTYIEILAPDGTTVVTTHEGLTGTSFDVPWSSFGGNPSGFIRVGAERDGYRSWQAYEIQIVFATLSTGSFTLTGFNANLYANPDMTADVGTFALTGNDANLYVNPILTAAQGSFTLTGQDAALSANNDPDFANVSLLLGFEGTNGATSTTDESPSPKTITFNGNAALSTAQQKFGASSLTLDGTGDYLDCGTSSDLYLSGDFTMEAFIRGTKSTHYIMTRHNATGNNQSLAFLVNTNKLAVFYSTNGSSGGTLTGTTTLTTATWYHACLERSGTTLRLYLNGVMEAKTTVSGALFNNSSTPFLIGRRADGTANDFLGNIDEIRVTKGVARYASDSGFTVPSAAYPRS